MKKLYATLFLSSLVTLSAMATVPVKRVSQYRQSDGTALTVTMRGNGRYVTYTTDDGLALSRGADGDYYYAALKDGELVSTALLAHNAGGRTASERQSLAQRSLSSISAADWLEARYPAQPLGRTTRVTVASTPDGLGKFKQPALGAVSSIGAPVIPIVMVDFADRAFQDTVTAEKVTRLFNEPGYADEPGAKGSVKDYFVAQSGGLFTPAFEVAAHVTVPQGYAYYGQDGANGAIDRRRSTFVADALSAADKVADFSKYATDGEIPLVALMFAGPGQQSSFEDGSEDYLWAQFSRQPYKVKDGTVRINSYFLGNELLQNYGSGPNDVRGAHVDGIGLFSHEFGHALGLPDLYYTGSNAVVSDTLKTMEYWSIMDYGQYYYDGYRPVGYTAYEKSFLGWLDVKELTEAQYAALYPYGREAEGNTAYLIRNPESDREYYLLENRQPDTWYPARMGSGMLVTHIDYDPSAWVANRVNNDPSHQRVSVVHADNVNEGHTTSADMSLAQLFAGYKADLFPGTWGAASLTDETVPATMVYGGETGKLGQPLYNITLRDDGVVTFSFIDANMTGIRSATADGADVSGDIPAYTLAGIRVPDLRTAAPGVYILANGKKVVKR